MLASGLAILSALKGGVKRLKPFLRAPKVAVPTLAVLLVGLATLLGLAYGLAVATFVVVIYTALFAAIPVIGWKPFEALPELSVGLRVDGETLTAVKRELTVPKSRLTSSQSLTGMVDRGLTRWPQPCTSVRRRGRSRGRQPVLAARGTLDVRQLLLFAAATQTHPLRDRGLGAALGCTLG